MVKNKFTIKGKKDLIFLKNENAYTVYDPINLEYYEIDELGAEILYLLSKNFSIKIMVDILMDEYEVSEQVCKETILNFFNTIPIKDLIYPNLISTDIYLDIEPFSKL